MHETLVEDHDGSFKPVNIKPMLKVARGINQKPLHRMVVWRRDFQGHPNIKEIVSSSNCDALVLQARGKVLKGAKACSHCIDEHGPFAACVINNIASTLMGMGACGNCIWGAHSDCCILNMFRLT